MKLINPHITVFEHQTIKLNQVINGVKINDAILKALQSYYGVKGVPFYSLVHNGIKFKEFVGVIQVGNLLIEVLPKADKSDASESKWRDILIGMLRAVGAFDIQSSSESNLKVKSNTILDLYFEMYLKEVEYLLHNGLIKQYRKIEGNVTALKGSLQFAKHLQQNLTHKERFYVNYTTYDVEHKLHFILYKTVLLLKLINTNANLHGRIGVLLLHFPEMPDSQVTDSTFEKLVFNRKNQSYKKAIEIAKLLLLQYHPDISNGRNHVLALMFDMNKLWEQFVYVSLRKNKTPETTITAQTSKFFWKPGNGSRSKMRPDIVINKDDKENCVVLDTKWKNLNGYNPSSNDLRQMYVYHEYYGAKRVALIYPGNPKKSSKGKFYPSKFYDKMDKECSIILLEVPDSTEANNGIIKTWQKTIHSQFVGWLNTAETKTVDTERK
ncbi:MAG: hypothetical protein COA31_007605 [Flavobacteriales bacterium]|nr:hypothetical protein [Flavobacteriales bacterium]